eukprot:SAG25_NODE_5997_length_598_cov_0.623246_1_plen_23_part_10
MYHAMVNYLDGALPRHPAPAASL